MDPLAILPAELWGMIFEQVEDPQDWLNLYRASPTFEEVQVVGDQRPNALLSQVLPHVYKDLDEDLSGMLRLRSVSRKWKDAVDTILNTRDGLKLFADDLKYEKYKFEDSAKISAFMDKFGTHPGNPFIGSFVLFLFDPMGKTEEMMEEFESHVVHLLDKFGMHIKKMHFISEGDLNLYNVLCQLKSCVELTPNLEELHVSLLNASDDYDYSDAVILNLGDHQMPIISGLKSFSFNIDASSSKLTDMQNLIIRMCCNPDTLTFAYIVGVPSALATFPKLEEAVMKIIPKKEHEFNLANYICPLLSHLTLKQHRGITVNSVLKYAAHFKETLIHLKIKCDWEDITLNSKLRFELPHLKYLTIASFRYGSPLSLLGNLPNLEVLRIRQPVPPTRQYTPLNMGFKWFVRFIELEMSKLQIWETFPKLRKVKLTSWQGKKCSAGRKVYYRKLN